MKTTAERFKTVQTNHKTNETKRLLHYK